MCSNLEKVILTHPCHVLKKATKWNKHSKVHLAINTANLYFPQGESVKNIDTYRLQILTENVNNNSKL